MFGVREDTGKVHHHALKLAIEGNIGSDGVANGALQQSRGPSSPGFNTGVVVQCTVFQNDVIPVCFSGWTVEYVHISLLRPFTEDTTDFQFSRYLQSGKVWYATQRAPPTKPLIDRFWGLFISGKLCSKTGHREFHSFNQWALGKVLAWNLQSPADKNFTQNYRLRKQNDRDVLSNVRSYTRTGRLINRNSPWGAISSCGPQERRKKLSGTPGTTRRALVTI